MHLKSVTFVIIGGVFEIKTLNMNPIFAMAVMI